jgi:hypothetical protein
MRDREKGPRSILEAADSTLDVIRTRKAKREINSQLTSQTALTPRNLDKLSLWKPKNK